MFRRVRFVTGIKFDFSFIVDLRFRQRVHEQIRSAEEGREILFLFRSIPVFNGADVFAVMEIVAFVVIDLVFESLALFGAAEAGIEIYVYVSVGTLRDKGRNG